jgi:hypothetical protein
MYRKLYVDGFAREIMFRIFFWKLFSHIVDFEHRKSSARVGFSGWVEDSAWRIHMEKTRGKEKERRRAE